MCVLCPVCMQASSLHKGTQRTCTQMGKQGYCLLFCVLLCCGGSDVIDFFAVRAKNGRGWQYIFSSDTGSSSAHMLIHKLNSKGLFPAPHSATIELTVTPLSVPITVCLPEKCR